jgi:UDP-glucose 4-epimerase
VKLFVTGGAGYIGSHVVRQLGEAGHEILVYDNLSSGHRAAVLHGELVVADLADEARLDAALSRERFDAVLHFAAHIEVSESVKDPLKYYANNTANTVSLLQACQRHQVDRFVFSSTAAVYGPSETRLIAEDNQLSPENPYGWSKLMSEQAMSDLARAGDFRYVALRYFNAAGADPQARIGECHEPETHLIPLALQVASGRRKRLQLFGTDYPTADGTCVRDYIHVEDLASAHLAALNYLLEGGAATVLNCGYGHGYSVREVVEATRRITGHAVPVDEVARRAGDPAELVADPRRIRERLDWTPRFDDLDTIIRDAWAWEQRYAASVAGRAS